MCASFVGETRPDFSSTVAGSYLPPSPSGIFSFFLPPFFVPRCAIVLSGGLGLGSGRLQKCRVWGVGFWARGSGLETGSWVSAMGVGFGTWG